MDKIVSILVVDKFYKQRSKVYQDQLYNSFRGIEPHIGLLDDAMLNTTSLGDDLRYLSNTGSFPALMIATLDEDKIKQVLFKVVGHSQIIASLRNGSFQRKYKDFISGVVTSPLPTRNFSLEFDNSKKIALFAAAGLGIMYYLGNKEEETPSPRRRPRAKVTKSSSKKPITETPKEKTVAA